MFTREMLADLFGLNEGQALAVLNAVEAVVGSHTWETGCELEAMSRALAYEVRQYVNDAQHLMADAKQVQTAA